MSDERAIAMVRNFTGQWLQLRDVEGIAIDARVVLARDNNTEKELEAQLAAFRARRFAQGNQQNPEARAANGQGVATPNGAAQPNNNGADPATPNAANGNAPASGSGTAPAVATNGAPATGNPANATGAAPQAPAVANGTVAGAAATPPAANGTNPAPAAANANGQPAAGARGAFGNGRRGFFGPPPVQLDGPLRNALRSEPEMLFEAIVREDRPLSELLDCDYTFVNSNLAKLYGIEKIVGPDMQRVEL